MRESLPQVDQAGAEPDRNPAFTYVPPSHAKAIDPDVSIVEGIRGAGKSFWWSHLSSPLHRRFIGAAFPEARFGEQILVAQGFGAQVSSSDSPSAEVLSSLLASGFSAKAIWRAVVAVKVGFKSPFPVTGRWKERVAWITENPEEFDDLLSLSDSRLVGANQTSVVMFDALDRLADDWSTIRPLAKGLFQTALDMRATKRIRLKLFVRPDMLEDRQITGFPDASKLLARRATLVWFRADLYALLFQCLGNSNTGGQSFRKLCEEQLDLTWSKAAQSWILPLALRRDEELQERVFIELAGKAMASGPSGYKRGKPYTWLVNHLQDGLDQVSPRSFFAAVRQASDETASDSLTAIDFKAIQAGVRAASQIRVNEITREDYPWVDFVMQPLRGNLTVPCLLSDIEALWNDSNTLLGLQGQLRAAAVAVKLPPQHLGDGANGVLIDLEALGLVKRLDNNRVQMPDVYRIAFGLGRRGGVKPLR